MKVIIGSDHAGYEHKAQLVKLIASMGHEPIDIGGFGESRIDYPDIAEKGAGAVAEGKADRCILICGTGIGMSLAANKVRGIRAALCYNTESAALARQHNNAQVLCLGARFFEIQPCLDMARTFLSEDFSQQERHVKRVEKIMSIEERNCIGEK